MVIEEVMLSIFLSPVSLFAGAIHMLMLNN